MGDILDVLDYPNIVLKQNNYIQSSNGKYSTVMQPDGNLVLYASGAFSAENALWASGTNGRGSGPYKCTMQSDNNLVVYDGSGAALWASNTWKKGQTGARCIMQNDGNLVVYDGSGKPIWASGTHR